MTTNEALVSIHSSAVRLKHAHYFKPSSFRYIDVYRVLKLFDVTDPCIAHAVKKLLVPGRRGGGKELAKDIQEAIDTLERWKEMREEELLAQEESGK